MSTKQEWKEFGESYYIRLRERFEADIEEVQKKFSCTREEAVQYYYGGKWDIKEEEC